MTSNVRSAGSSNSNVNSYSVCVIILYVNHDSYRDAYVHAFVNIACEPIVGFV